MTCEDCYHYDVCHRRINSIDFLPIIKGKVSISPILYKNCDDVGRHCLHFKHKSQIIELPMEAADWLKEELTKYCYERCIDEL